MNIIVVSLERCGNSWMCAIISDVYESIYGNLLQWNHEISRVYAVDSKYPLPKGCASVYDVSPQLLLNRGYDKIIVLERNLEVIERVFWLAQSTAHKLQLSYEDALFIYPYYFNEIRKYCNFVYGKKIEDPHLFWVSLDDLNNYTVDTFNQLFDFLDFPKDTRPTGIEMFKLMVKHWIDEYGYFDSEQLIEKIYYYIKDLKIRAKLLPVNPPERNWQVYSDQMARGHEVNDILKMVELKYMSNKTEAQIQMAQIHNYNANAVIRNKAKNITYKYCYNINPYKMAPEERKWQKNRSFRILLEKMPDALEVMEKTHCDNCKIKMKSQFIVGIWENINRKWLNIDNLVVCEACKKILGVKILK